MPVVRYMVFFIWLWVVVPFLYAQPEGYYKDAEGYFGEELAVALHDIIDDHTVLSYSQLWTAFQTTDRKSDGTVWDMYSDIPGGSPDYTYLFVTDQCGNYSGEGSCYNREHSFPKSWFNDGSPMYTDLFHLYPTDGYVNGKRGNYPFGETNTPSWVSSNGSAVGPCSAEGYTGTVFEPIDSYKGDFARTYFYMGVRYRDEDAGWPGSPMVNGAQLKPWALEMMIRWHLEDPVSDKEINRNDAVYELQGNRNPFIDHPEFVETLFSGIPDEEAPEIDSIVVHSETLVHLWFSEPLDSTSAIDPANFQFTGGVTVINARLNNPEHTNVEIGVSGLQNGSYTLTVNGVSDVAGNTMILAFYAFEVSGLETSTELIATEALKLYPNPARQRFFLEVSAAITSIIRIELVDTQGKSYSCQHRRAADRIEISTALSDGPYYVFITDQNGFRHGIPVIIH